MNFDKVLNFLKKHNPDIKIYYKDESWLMWLLSLVLFFVPDFNTRFITTIGNSVYFPSKKFIENNDILASVVLIHEFVHIEDSKYYGIFFPLGYLFPQILTLLAPIVMLFNFWTGLLFLLFLAPWPAYFRKYFEVRGYTASLFSLDIISDSNNENIDALALNDFNKYFTGSSYYFMWPFGVSSELKMNLEKARSGDIFNEDKTFKICQQAAMLIE